MIRHREPELMDDDLIDPREHDAALRALDRTRRLLGVDRQLFDAVRRFGDVNAMSILDVGAGGGGFLGYVRRRVGSDAHAELIGLDRSEHAVWQARRWHANDIRFMVGDALEIPLGDRSVDVVTCSLLVHHFEPEDGVRLLREAARVARRGVVIGDLERSSLAWCTTWVMTRVLSRSRLFHVDGPRSVRAALRREELGVLAERAGLQDARIDRRFPFRMLLTWTRPEHGNGAN